ncbi:hypothetical protein B0H11DRAFT_2020087 [Mycena galericulata]|nr:hypothetical protein B0H11DRAFT_2020087 [Mycena galericulata]
MDDGDEFPAVEQFGCIALGPLHWNPICRWSFDELENDSAISEEFTDCTSDLRTELHSVCPDGCFLQNTHHITDQAVHVIDSWCRDPIRQRQTTNTLRQLGIVPKDFLLESVSNVRWLDPRWHKAMDTYAAWAWAPSNTTLDYMLAILKVERLSRERVARQLERDPWRQWDPAWMDSPLILFEPILLYPEALFNGNEPLVRFEEGTFSLFYPNTYDGRLHLDSADGHVLWPSSSPKLNPFLVALSCHNKLLHYVNREQRRNRLDLASPIYDLFTKLESLVDEIWRPLRTIPGETRASPFKPHSMALLSANMGDRFSSLRLTDPLASDSANGMDGVRHRNFLPHERSTVPGLPVAVHTTVPENRAHFKEDTRAFEEKGNPRGSQAEEDSDSPLAAVNSFLSTMDVAERVAYGQQLFFQPIRDWEDELPAHMGHNRSALPTPGVEHPIAGTLPEVPGPGFKPTVLTPSSSTASLPP